MKVRFTAEMKRVVTVAEMPAVRSVIEYMKEDQWEAKDYAEMAARIAIGCNDVKVIDASARIAANSRIWNAIAEDSMQYDVWVEFTAFANNGFVMGGVCVTDLWNYSSDNRDDIIPHMYIRKFIEVK